MIEGMRPNGGGNGGGKPPGGGGGKPGGSRYSFGAVVEWILAYTAETSHDLVLRGCALPFFAISCGGIWYIAANLYLPHTACRYGKCTNVGGWGDIAAQALIVLSLLLVGYFGIRLWKAGTFSDNNQKVRDAVGQDIQTGQVIAEVREQANKLLGDTPQKNDVSIV